MRRALRTASESVPSPNPRKPSGSRSKFRFSLATLLIFGLAVAILLGFLGRELERRRRRAEVIEELSSVGATLTRGFTLAEGDSHGNTVLTGDDSMNEVSLDSRKGATDDHVALLAKLKGFVSVHLTGEGFTDRALEPLGEIETLETLGLHGTSITGSGLALWKGREKVRRLGFTERKPGLADDPLAAISSLPNIETLHWFEGNLTKVRVEELTRLEKLDKLYLEPIRSFDSDAIESFGELDQVRELRFLGPHSISLGDPHASAIARMDRLRTLYQPGSALTDQGMKELANSPRIEALDLNSPLVTGEGVRHLSATTTLRDVSLYDTKITDDALEGLWSLPKLRFLVLKNPVSVEAAREFAKAHPKCRVWWFGPGNQMENFNDHIEPGPSSWIGIRPQPWL